MTSTQNTVSNVKTDISEVSEKGSLPWTRKYGMNRIKIR